MSLVSISGGATGTGTFTVLAPSTNTNRTLTLPDATGTVVSTGSTAVVSQAMLATNVAGNGPAFSANNTSGQSFSNSTFTKVQVNVETFDTNSNYDPTTNYRFTPTVAGYYQVNANLSFGGASLGYVQVAIYKNVLPIAYGSGIPNNTQIGGMAMVSTVTFLNGSTDYVEFYGWQNSGGALALQTQVGRNTFSGAMVRGA